MRRDFNPLSQITYFININIYIFLAVRSKYFIVYPHYFHLFFQIIAFFSHQHYSNQLVVFNTENITVTKCFYDAYLMLYSNTTSVGRVLISQMASQSFSVSLQYISFSLFLLAFDFSSSSFAFSFDLFFLLRRLLCSVQARASRGLIFFPPDAWTSKKTGRCSSVWNSPF